MSSVMKRRFSYALVLTVVSATTLFANRVHVVDSGARALPVLLGLAGLVAFVELSRAGHLMRGEAGRATLLPFALMASVDFAVVVITAFRFDPSPLKGIAYIVVGGAVVVSPFASNLLGVWVADRPSAARTFAYLTIVPSAIAGGFELAGNRGLETPVSRLLGMLDASTAGVIDLAGRAHGFEVDPNMYGLLGVPAVAYTLANRKLGSGHAVTISAFSAAVVWFSGSRTALGIVGALFVVCLLSRALHRRRPEEPSWRRLVLVAASVVLTSAALAAPWSPTQSSMLGRTTAEYENTGAADEFADEVSSGRIAIWRTALQAYVEQPLGQFEESERSIGLSVHNDYIDRVLWGGPLMLAALLACLVLLAFRVRVAESPQYPLLLATAIALAAIALPATRIFGLMIPGAFLLGAQSSSVNEEA